MIGENCDRIKEEIIVLIKITESDELDCVKLMPIYEESNIQNAEYFYPQLKNKTEAQKKAETDYCNYIKNDFLNGQNSFYVWEDNGVWISALRLYRVEDNFYFIEALETMPGFRNKGYAEQLLNSVIRELKANGKFKIYDCVGKNNRASLSVHQKCGFKRVSEYAYDYLQNEIDEHSYGLEYSFQGADIS